MPPVCSKNNGFFCFFLLPLILQVNFIFGYSNSNNNELYDDLFTTFKDQQSSAVSPLVLDGLERKMRRLLLEHTDGILLLFKKCCIFNVFTLDRKQT